MSCKFQPPRIFEMGTATIYRGRTVNSRCPYFLWYLLLCLFLGPAVIGARQTDSPDYRARYNAPPEKVWEAVVKVLGDLPIKEADAGRQTIETEWMEGWSHRPFGAFRGGIMGGQWKRRMQMVLRLRPGPDGGTEVRLISRVQEKPPGGTQAYRWKPVASDGKMEREIMGRIDAGLVP